MALKHYYGGSGYALASNVLASCFLGLMTITVILRGLNNPIYVLSASLLCVLAWSFIFTLLLGFRITGPFILMIGRMFVGDVLRFCVIYIVILIGFSGGFYVLEASDTDSLDGLSIFADRIRTLFLILLGSFDFDGFQASLNPDWTWLSFILLVMYVVIMAIMLFNLLIAMMGETYNRTKEDADKVWHMTYAKIISSMEEEAGLRGRHHYPDHIQYWMELGEGEHTQKWLEVEEVDREYWLQEEDKTPEGTHLPKGEKEEDKDAHYATGVREKHYGPTEVEVTTAAHTSVLSQD